MGRATAALMIVAPVAAGCAAWLAACGGPAFSAAASLDGGVEVGPADALTNGRADATDGTVVTPDAQADAEVRFTTVTVIAMGDGPAGKGIALDDDRVYWAEQDATGIGSIHSAAKSGAGTPTTIASKQPQPLDVAVLEGTALYWSVASPGPSAATNCLAMVDSKTTLDIPVCLTKANYTTTRMAAASSFIALLTYQGAQNPNMNPFLGFVPTGVVTPSYTAFPAMGPSVAIAATDQAIFSANRGHVDEYAVGPPISAAPPFCQTNCAGGTSTIVDMAIDVAAINVLWVTADSPSGGTIYSQAIPPSGVAGPTMGAVVGTFAGTPQRMARDASYVYVTTLNGAEYGSVLAVPLGGGASRTLASMENGPFGVAVDKDNVFWTLSDGSVHAVGVPQ
jgi:hypothetical protein